MSKKILLVDDDKELCQELEEILKNEGYSVDAVLDSGQGAILIERGKYDLFIFDYKMEGLSGIDLLRKAEKINPRAAVFIVSGRPAIEKILEEEKAISLVTDVISKPFDIETLLQKIKALA